MFGCFETHSGTCGYFKVGIVVDFMPNQSRASRLAHVALFDGMRSYHGVTVESDSFMGLTLSHHWVNGQPERMHM